MHGTARRRTALVVAVMLALAPLVAGYFAGAAEKDKTESFEGKVVPLAGLLDKFGSKLDPEAAPHWLALVTRDGKTYPLIRDAGARLFFKDERLLNRPMRLGGRLYQDTHLLQVVSVNSIVNGQRCDVYYWCDVCSIRRAEKQPQCECCGGPMKLREVPLKK